LEFRQPGIPQMLRALAALPATLGITAPVASMEVEKPSVEVQQVLPLLQLGLWTKIAL
jgi:hypothetical protein